jgi:DNA-binding NtrC family response regulator
MQKKILIVDDETSIIEVIQEHIENSGLGCTSVGAMNVDQALKIIDDDRPDVIITDIAMPGKNGLDLLKEVAQRGLKIPVIVVSGYGDKDMISKAWKLGALDFLDKPISSKRLLGILQTALETDTKKITTTEAAPILVKLMMDPKLVERAKKAADASQKPVEQWIMDLISRSIP